MPRPRMGTVLYTCEPNSHAQMNTCVRSYVHGHRKPHAVRSQMGKAGTLPGQLEHSAQIPLPALTAIGHEVQTTLDQCERLAPDLVIRHDLAMPQNQPKLTADWFTHRMSATHKPAAAASKKRAMQELNDQHALGGNNSYQSISTWQQTAPTSP